ncbi:MAG: hypothetical protein EON92_18365 [Burkholderiales bacterium]|nr:MAG: hypothetical protein EON92_18365 [Burkholderiales bacterium]
MILSRTFNRADPGGDSFEHEVAALRRAEHELAARSPEVAVAQGKRIAADILRIAAGMATVR